MRYIIVQGAVDVYSEGSVVTVEQLSGQENVEKLLENGIIAPYEEPLLEEVPQEENATALANEGQEDSEENPGDPFLPTESEPAESENNTESELPPIGHSFRKAKRVGRSAE